MNYKSFLKILIAVIAIWILVLIFGLCKPVASANYSCTGGWLISIGDASQFLLFVPAVLLFLSIVSLFFAREVFLAWSKFSVIWIILSGLIVILTPKYSSGGLGFNIGIDKELVSWYSAAGLLVISLVIIFVKGRKVREGNQ